MSFIDLTPINIATSVARAIMTGKAVLRKIFGITLILTILAIGTAALAESGFIDKGYNALAGALGIIAGIGILSIYAYQQNIEITAAQAEIKKVEEQIKTNPHETTAAWELGRLKLESYLTRNLKQVRWIFIWTVIVMIAGFVILGYGIIKVFNKDANLDAGILTTVCGLIIEFIGGSFLLIYRSTMDQAKGFVTVLERINAVGMSVQILDSISKEGVELQNQTKADLAKKLLDLYGAVK